MANSTGVTSPSTTTDPSASATAAAPAATSSTPLIPLASPTPTASPTTGIAAPPSTAVAMPAPVAPAAPAPAAGLPNQTATPVSQTPLIASVSPNELTSTQLGNVLSSGSPLLQSAQTSAAQASAARGLQNSTLGVQAGEQALINTATPIAEANASTIANQASQNLQTENNFGLQAAGVTGQEALATQSGKIQSQLSTQGASQSSALQAQQAGETSALTTQEAQAQLTNLSQQGAQALTQIAAQTQGNISVADVNNAAAAVLSAQAAGQNLTLTNQQYQNQQALLVTQYGQSLGLNAAQTQSQLTTLNATNQNALSQITANTAAYGTEYSQQLGGQYLASVSNYMSSTSSEIASIYSTQGLTAQQQQTAVATAYAQMQSNIQALGSYYSSSPMWNANVNTGPGAPGAIPLPGIPP